MFLNPSPSQVSKKDEVSVVIPYYNSATTIKRAVESALSQTYPVLEVIIVDDGSTKEQVRLLQEFSAGNQKIRLILSGSNKGPASARNAGWDAARGDWIAFLDSDDAWHVRKIELQMSAAYSQQILPGLVGSTTKILLGNVEETTSTEAGALKVSAYTTWELLLKNRFSTPTVMLRADLPVRFSEGRKYSEDYELWLRISQIGESLVRIELPLAYLFKAPYGESGLSSHIFSMAAGELRTFKQLYDDHLLSRYQLLIAGTISALKSIRRIVIVAVAKAKKNLSSL